MNGRDDPVTELDLLAYVDGHLEPARQRIVEAWLATHPDDARRVAADIAINDGIRRLFRDSYLETPPAHLTEALETRRPAIPVSVAAAIALVLGAVGLGGGWWAGRSDLPVAMPAAQQAPGGARLVAAADDTDAVDWLASHVSANIRLPDLRSAGLRLVGQSVVGGPNKPTVQLTFADEGNQRIDLFLQPRVDDAQFRYEEADGRGLLSWTNGPVVFALTGDMPADRLQALAEQVYAAARQGPSAGVPDRMSRPAGAAAPPPGILPVASEGVAPGAE